MIGADFAMPHNTLEHAFDGERVRLHVLLEDDLAHDARSAMQLRHGLAAATIAPDYLPRTFQIVDAARA